MSPFIARLSRCLLPTLLFGWSSLAFAADPIYLGLNLPRTGQYAQEGLMQMRGALLAVDELNQAGGVLGRPLQLLERDSASSPERARRNVDELANEGARMLFGGASSAVAIAAGQRARERGLLYFGTLTYSNDTTGAAGHRYMFRESYNAWMAARVLSAQLQKQFAGKRYYYVTADYTWGHSTEQSMRHFTDTTSTETHGATLVPFPNASLREMRESLQKAKDADPEVLVLVLFGEQMVKAMSIVRQLRFDDVQVVVPNLTLSMVEQAGPAVMAGVMGAVPWAWNVPAQFGYARGEGFVGDFVERYETYPSSSAASAYSIVYQWADAVTRTGSLDSETLIRALEGHSYELLKDTQTWRTFDHQNLQTVYAVRIKPRAEVMADPLHQDYFEILDSLAGEQAAQTLEQWQTVRREAGQPLTLQ